MASSPAKMKAETYLCSQTILFLTKQLSPSFHFFANQGTLNQSSYSPHSLHACPLCLLLSRLRGSKNHRESLVPRYQIAAPSSKPPSHVIRHPRNGVILGGSDFIPVHFSNFSEKLLKPQDVTQWTEAVGPQESFMWLQDMTMSSGQQAIGCQNWPKDTKQHLLPNTLCPRRGSDFLWGWEAGRLQGSRKEQESAGESKA